MNTRFTVSSVVLSLIFVGAAAGAPQQPAATQPTGTGRVSGQVVAADNGAPVRRAVVLLSGMARSASPSGSIEGGVAPGVAGGLVGGLPASVPARDTVPGQPNLPPGMVSRQAETDDAGRFDFANLPAGQFSLFLSSVPTGFVRPDRSEPARLADGESASLTLKLVRTGAITGRVLDEFGEPLARVNVQAMRRDTTAGRLAGVSGGFATTDDLGQFRLYGLPAGEYYVVGTYGGGQMMAPIGEPGTTAAAAPRTGYGPTYYPGSVTSEGGRRVPVRSGQDTTGIEFSLQRVALGRIVGTAIDSKGAPLAGYAPMLDANGRTVGTTEPPQGRGSVSVSSHEQPNSGRGAVMRPDGTFQVNDLPPGDYTVVATLMRGQGPAAQRETAFTEVSVAGNDVTVNLQTNQGATLSGRVVVEGDDSMTVGPSGRPIAAAPFRVAVRPDATQSSFVNGGAPSVQVAEDGTFTISGVWGAGRIAAMGGRGVLKSIFRGGQDVTAKSMTFKGTERIVDIVVTMTTETGTLQGMVTDSQGEGVADAVVMIFPDDPERWFLGSTFVTSARSLAAPNLPPGRPATSPQPVMPQQQAGGSLGQSQSRFVPVTGAFMTTRLLPGRYFVAALSPGTVPMMDRDALEKLRAVATAVSINASSEPTTVQLRLTK